MDSLELPPFSLYKDTQVINKSYEGKKELDMLVLEGREIYR